MNRNFPPHAGTAHEMAAAVAAGYSPARIAEDLIANIGTVDGQVRAFAYFDADELRARAENLPDGPLRGVTIAVKDVLLTRDMPTAHNSPRYEGSMPGIDAACVDTLRQAGALIAGKVTTSEFASTTVGPGTTNPHDARRTPGGSSSGSAAAVAAGLTALAIGTQTGGSTIRPASFCGVFGMKPTWNAISREGSKMYSATCDTIGLYARSAMDFELLADVFDFDVCDLPETLEGLRVGVTYGTTPEAADDDTRAAMDGAIANLQAAGATVVDLALPPDFDGILDAHHIILAREGASAFLNEVRSTPNIEEFFTRLVSQRPTAAAARSAYKKSDRCRALIDRMFEDDIDLILTPSATGVAPIGTGTGDPVFNAMWTLLQVPVINIPFHKTIDNLPVGVSFIGRRYDDRKLIRIARLIAEAPSEPLNTSSLTI